MMEGKRDRHLSATKLCIRPVAVMVDNFGKMS